MTEREGRQDVFGSLCVCPYVKVQGLACRHVGLFACSPHFLNDSCYLMNDQLF